MTTDDGSSLGQAAVHENVRHDIARADARQMAVTANRDLIHPYVDLNFGPQKKYPVFVIPVTENEDIKALVDAIESLVPLGLKVSMPEVRSRIGFEEPADDVELMTPPKAVKAIPSGGEPDADDPDKTDDKTPGAAKIKKAVKKAGADIQAEARIGRCPDCGGRHALAAEMVDEVDQLVEEALGNWEADTAPLFEPLKALFDRAKSYEDLQSGLDDMAAKLDPGPMADRLAKLTMLARGIGDAGKGGG